MKKGESNIINALALEYRGSLEQAFIRASDLDVLAVEALLLNREVAVIFFPPEEEEVSNAVIENIEKDEDAVNIYRNNEIESSSDSEDYIPDIPTDLNNNQFSYEFYAGSPDSDDPYADLESVERCIAGLNIAIEGGNWI